MRIAHCIHGLGLGGAQKVIASIVRGTERLDAVFFVYSNEDGELRAEIEASGSQIRIVRRLVPNFDAQWVARLAVAFRRDGIDLVHTHLFGDSLHGYLAARLAGSLPVVMTLHTGPEGMTRPQRVIYGRLLRRADRSVACSHAVRDAVKDQLAVGATEIEVIQNGIEPLSAMQRGESRVTLREKLGIGRDEVALAAIGRLEEEKGNKYLVSAFSRLMRASSDSEHRLLFLGGGSLQGTLERQVQQEGLDARRVRFLGFVPNSAELLPALDVVVFSSLYEGLPIALLEAMRAGKCIVATLIPGIREAVRHQIEALLVPAADPDRLYEAIQGVVESPNTRERLGECAQRRFEKDFTAARMVQQYEVLYESLGASPVGAPQDSPRSRGPTASGASSDNPKEAI